MTKEEDISRFADIGNALSEMYIDFKVVYGVTNAVSERTSLYLEFLAGAFLKETGLKASETELVVSYGTDKVIFSFRRKNGNGSNGD